MPMCTPFYRVNAHANALPATRKMLYTSCSRPWLQWRQHCAPAFERSWLDNAVPSSAVKSRCAALEREQPAQGAQRGPPIARSCGRCPVLHSPVPCLTRHYVHLAPELEHVYEALFCCERPPGHCRGFQQDTMPLPVVGNLVCRTCTEAPLPRVRNRTSRAVRYRWQSLGQPGLSGSLKNSVSELGKVPRLSNRPNARPRIGHGARTATMRSACCEDTISGRPLRRRVCEEWWEFRARRLV